MLTAALVPRVWLCEPQEHGAETSAARGTSAPKGSQDGAFLVGTRSVWAPGQHKHGLGLLVCEGTQEQAPQLSFRTVEKLRGRKSLPSIFA